MLQFKTVFTFQTNQKGFFMLSTLTLILFIIQRSISACGVIIILCGVILALSKYIHFLWTKSANTDINKIRLQLGLVLTLGLECIVAADLIGTTTAPDYYSVGILAAIVLIRTMLSFTLNKEINALSAITHKARKL